MLTIIENNELKWNINYILENPKFVLKNKLYQTHNNNVIIFESNEVKYRCKNYMIHYIATNYTLDDKTSKNRSCYFCEFTSSDATMILNNNGRHICELCTSRWMLLKDNFEKITDTIFKFNDTDNRVIKYDAISYKLHYL